MSPIWPGELNLLPSSTRPSAVLSSSLLQVAPAGKWNSAGADRFLESDLPEVLGLLEGERGPMEVFFPVPLPRDIFLRGNPFLMSLNSLSTMQPSSSLGKGGGLIFFPPPSFARLASSSAFFFSLAILFSSWIRNCSFSYLRRETYFSARLANLHARRFGLLLQQFAS